MAAISYQINPPLSNEALNTLFMAAWEAHTETDFAPILSHSLLYVGAFSGKTLVGFVNEAWDGGIHAFLLDTTVHPDFQHQGIGTALVRHAADAARDRGMEWLHVDFEPHLLTFYRDCGFIPTDAGLMHLKGGTK